MPSRQYHESLWEAVPEGLTPQFAQLRRSFLLARVPAGARVLDVGCGEGWFAAALLDAGALPVGIDVAAEPLRRAGAARPELDLRLVEEGGAWPLQDAEFDVVWAGEVIEHVTDTAGWLSEVRRVLRPGGMLLLSTPAHDLLTRLRLAFAPGAFVDHFDPRGDHLRFYTRASLRSLIEDFRFDEVRIAGAAGLPGARRLLLASARRQRF
ncbi:MAG TPA: class I SAM-dependent methyltransferase [Solirubrobacteraceae bacterium]|jgi:2-polyprenyl-3-methyl-5-hydroxy-6-metoxy-1,4-benzoquinol methylase